MSWRQRLSAFIGGFDAGQHHRRLRGFQATRAHVNALIAASGPDITARARWLVRNNGYAVNAVESWAANTVGDGIKPISKLADATRKEDLQRLAHLPDIEDIKCAYPRLDALGFDCNAGNEETKADAAEKWDRINNGYRGSNPYERDGTFYFCAKEPRDGWEEAAMGGGRKVWKVGTNFFVAKEPEYANWEEYDLPKTQKVWKVPMGKTLADAIRSDTSFDFKDMRGVSSI